MTLIELTEDDFAALLRGDASVKNGIAQPPGGVEQPDVLEHIHRIFTNLHRDGYAGGHWMMVTGGEVVGICGFKAPPSKDGQIEIGYSVARRRRRCGYATAAVAAIVEIARRDPKVREVVALTALDNVMSQRVLERNSFERLETRLDSDDGEVFVWRKRLYPLGR